MTLCFRQRTQLFPLLPAPPPVVHTHVRKYYHRRSVCGRYCAAVRLWESGSSVWSSEEVKESEILVGKRRANACVDARTQFGLKLERLTDS